MRKLRVLLTVLILLLSANSHSAQAIEVPEPNKSCSTEGDFGIAKGKMMTCTRSSSGLKWHLNSNVIAGGLCTAWTPGDTSTWAELQLLIKGSWVTQLQPIAFTPGPPCDNTKKNSSIPWISLTSKIADGTKYRWVKGSSGKDGHGGRAFGKGYPDPVFTYTAKSMQAKYLKTYTAIVSPVLGPHVFAALSNSNSKVSIFKAAIPILIPVEQSGPITFTNVVEKFDQIPLVAWQKTQAVLSKNSQPDIALAIYTGPNTKLDFPGGESQIRESILKTAKLFSGFAQTPYLSVISYVSQDEPWAEDTLRSIAKNRKYANIDGPLSATKGNCQTSSTSGQLGNAVTECRGSNAGSVYDSDDSHMELGMTGTSTDPYILSGALPGHEYVHTLQAANWIGAPDCDYKTTHCFRSGKANIGFSPCWIYEGLPQIGGRLAVSSTFQDYQDLRKGLPYGWGSTTITDYKESSLHNYLINQVPSTCGQNFELYKLGYSIGALTTEALVAIAGPQALMAIYALGAEGNDFPMAFQKVFNISWSDASAILAKVLAAEYATYGPAPK